MWHCRPAEIPFFRASLQEAAKVPFNGSFNALVPCHPKLPLQSQHHPRSLLGYKHVSCQFGAVSSSFLIKAGLSGRDFSSVVHDGMCELFFMVYLSCDWQ